MMIGNLCGKPQIGKTNERQAIYQAAAVIQEICNSRTGDDACTACPFCEMCGMEPYTWKIPREGS